MKIIICLSVKGTKNYEYRDSEKGPNYALHISSEARNFEVSGP